MKIELALGILAAAVFGLIGQGEAQAAFHSRPISIFGGSNVLVTGINDSGQMVANYTDSSGMSRCVSIAGSTMFELVDPNEVGTGPGKGTSCWGINNAGQIVGSYSAATFGNGFFYSGGVFTDIIVPGATAGTTTYGLNNVGNIVGSFADNVGQHGFVYTISKNAYATLNVPGAFASLALAINDHGKITFEWVDSIFIYHGATFQGGVYTVLDVTGAAQSKARGINNHGQIVYNAQDTSGVWHGFLYSGGRFVQFDVANSTNTYSFGLNSSALIVGGFNPTAKPSAEVGFQGHM